MRSKQRNVDDDNMPLYICLYEMRYILIKDFCKFRNGSLRSIGQLQKNPILYTVELKKVTNPCLIKCGMDESVMFNVNKFITENSLISRGNTTHWFGRHTDSCRFASILTGREAINCKLLKV